MSEKKIIFIDDQVHLRELVRDSFSNEFTIFLAKNFSEICDILEKHEIGVVVSDYLMPQEDGITVLSKLKEMNSDIRRVLVSGNLNLEITMKGVNLADIHAIMHKPWKRKDFIEIINQQLEEYYKLIEKKKELMELKDKIEELQIPEQSDMLLDMMFTLSESTHMEDFTNQFIKAIDGMKSMLSLNTSILFETKKQDYMKSIMGLISDIEVFSNQYDQKILMMYSELLRGYYYLYNDDFDQSMKHYKSCLNIMQWLSEEHIDDEFLSKIREFPLMEDYEIRSKDEIKKSISEDKVKRAISQLLQYDIGNLVNISEMLYKTFEVDRHALEYIIIVKDDLPVYERSLGFREYNVGLISGFVVALSHFLQEVVSGSGDINAISHENGMILFFNIDNVKYVLLTAIDDAFYRIGLRNFAYSIYELIQEIPESHYPTDEEHKEINQTLEEIFRIT